MKAGRLHFAILTLGAAILLNGDRRVGRVVQTVQTGPSEFNKDELYKSTQKGNWDNAVRQLSGRRCRLVDDPITERRRREDDPSHSCPR
jgi:hypothetical protein